ncbi:MAG: DUF3151 family protein [Acidobacteriota bacterium]|nr:DUF3151 family protein [Acidobacteriota bacterium]
MSAAPPETVLDPPAPEQSAALEAASSAPADARPGALRAVARAFPDWPAAWAALGEAATDDLDAYAYFRVGYHRGLDALRKSGWRGSGYVRWAAAPNRGFLRCLAGLERSAGAIGEEEEAQRCATFLRQLDPAWSVAGPGPDGT